MYRSTEQVDPQNVEVTYVVESEQKTLIPIDEYLSKYEAMELEYVSLRNKLEEMELSLKDGEQIVANYKQQSEEPTQEEVEDQEL